MLRKSLRGKKSFSSSSWKNWIKNNDLISLAQGNYNVNACVDGWTPLGYAIHKGKTDAVQVILEKSEIEVNKVFGRQQWTALIYAIDVGLSEAIQLLVSKGADIHKAVKVVSVHTGAAGE